MGETIEEHMCKTRGDYGSGVARPKIDDKAHFELKGQFLKELHDNTFSGSDHEDANEHIEKVLETYYTQFGVPFPQGGQYRAATPGFYQRNNGNPSYQERRKIREESLSKFMAESAKIHEENSYLIKEIRASMDAAIRIQGSSIKALEIQIGQMSKVLKERGSGNLPSSTEMNPRDHVKSISTIVETDTTSIRRIGPTQYAVSGPQNNKLFFVPSQATIPFLSHLYDDCCDEEEGSNMKRTKGIAENVLVRIDKLFFLIDFIVLDMPKDIKTSLILGIPFLSTSHAKIDMFKRKITLREGNDKVVFKSDKPTSNIIKRSLDPLYGDYIKLNDLNKPLEIRRNQVDDLEPTIKEGEVVDEPKMDIVKTRCYNEIVDGLDEYPS
ncbi:ribonuclease H-like domain, reverse transcriptase, RNA-dependent DNA polymerase [Tanacetum coccineum]